MFERDVIFTDWNMVTREADANLAWENFHENLVEILDRHAPYRQMRVSDSMPKCVTREFIEACDARDHLYRVFSKNKTEENKARMKRSRNFATKLKQDLKKNYFSVLQKIKGIARKSGGL